MEYSLHSVKMRYYDWFNKELSANSYREDSEARLLRTEKSMRRRKMELPVKYGRNTMASTE